MNLKSVWVLLLTTFVCLLNSMSGSGTSGDPYRIVTMEDMNQVRNHLDSYFVLMNDIDFTGSFLEGHPYYNGGTGWLPIGTFVPDGDWLPTPEYTFRGVFNGNNHKLIGLQFFRGSSISHQGLFGCTIGATISNLGVIVDFTSDGDYLGSLVGGAYNSSILNCYSKGNVLGMACAGGLLGKIDASTVEKCYNEATLWGSYYYGGFVGSIDASSTITNCYNVGNVGPSVDYASAGGGFFGIANSGNITNCYSTGQVPVSSSGGFGGSWFSCPLTNCFWDNEHSTKENPFDYADGEILGITGKTTTEMKNVATFTNLTTAGLTSPYDFVGNPNNDVANEDFWDINSSINNGYPYLTVFGGGGTLPVTLSAFTAITNTSGFVGLQWVTESENNLVGYNVFRGNDGVYSNAVRLNNTVIRAENVSNQHIYSYTDNTIEPETNYSYWLEAVEMSGINTVYGPVSLKTKPADDNNTPADPMQTKFNTLYPNPFNPSVTLAYSLAQSEKVSIRVYNAKGELVKILLNKNQNTGTYRLTWDGNNQSGQKCGTGIYYFKMQAGEYQTIHKALLVK